MQRHLLLLLVLSTEERDAGRIVFAENLAMAICVWSLICFLSRRAYAQ
jgi:hypothetical protein